VREQAGARQQWCAGRRALVGCGGPGWRMRSEARSAGGSDVRMVQEHVALSKGKR
jgi:hypothetical protein